MTFLDLLSFPLLVIVVLIAGSRPGSCQGSIVMVEEEVSGFDDKVDLEVVMCCIYAKDGDSGASGDEDDNGGRDEMGACSSKGHMTRSTPYGIHIRKSSVAS